MITPSRLQDSRELILGKHLELCLVLVKPSISNLFFPEPWHPYWSPNAAESNYHTFGGLKLHRFILLQVSRVRSAAFLLEALGKMTCSLAFSGF